LFPHISLSFVLSRPFRRSPSGTPDTYPLSLHDALPIWACARGECGLSNRSPVTGGEVALAQHLGRQRAVGTLFSGEAVVTDDREDRKSTTSELQSRFDLVCRLLLEKKKKNRSY